MKKTILTLITILSISPSNTYADVSVSCYGDPQLCSLVIALNNTTPKQSDGPGTSPGLPHGCSSSPFDENIVFCMIE